MKRNVIFIILCIFLAFIRMNCCYAQIKEIKKYKDVKLEGSLLIEWFFDKKTENLTIQIKNGYRFRVEIVQRKDDPPFYLDKIYKHGKTKAYDYFGFGFSDTKYVLKLEPDSVYRNTYKLDYKQRGISKIIIRGGSLPFMIIDEHGESIALCVYHQKEKCFDYQ